MSCAARRALERLTRARGGLTFFTFVFLPAKQARCTRTRCVSTNRTPQRLRKHGGTFCCCCSQASQNEPPSRHLLRPPPVVLSFLPVTHAVVKSVGSTQCYCLQLRDTRSDTNHVGSRYLASPQQSTTTAFVWFLLTYALLCMFPAVVVLPRFSLSISRSPLSLSLVSRPPPPRPNSDTGTDSVTSDNEGEEGKGTLLVLPPGGEGQRLVRSNRWDLQVATYMHLFS